MYLKLLLNEKLVNVITGAVTGENMANNQVVIGAIGVKNMVTKKKMVTGQVAKSTGNNVKKNETNDGRQSC